MENTFSASVPILVILLGAAVVLWVVLRSLLRLTRRLFTLGCLALLFLGIGLILVILNT